jgi:Kef-type K+ transport system membrane component KefB/mannitol/fructose-specific phosphotransferase system IIA component (Ntr-type)
METIHYLSEEHILLFLVQVFILLSLAKIIGGMFLRWGYPPLAGEILTGILLGPTILGRVAPGMHAALFPPELIQQNMLETVSWFGVLFLLLATGFEVSLSSAIKQGKAAFMIGIIGVVIPFGIGCGAFWWLPQTYWGANASHLTFTLFMATAASISAIAVIARILHDLEILKSDLGLTALSGFVVNDLLGWLIFAFVLGFISQHRFSAAVTMRTFFEIVLFGAVCLTIGSPLVGILTARLKRMRLPHPATVLTFISCLALLCGAITQWIGIHAILGFFLAGIMAGNTSQISQRTREILSQMVHAVFVPLFFANIGLKVDFAGNFDSALIVIFSAVAIGGKFIGAWIGARAARMPRADSLSMGIAFIPGGAMEIILGMLALELGLITESGFVAIVFAALLSSVAVGPLLAWSIRRRQPVNISSFFLRNATICNLTGQSRWDVIPKLCKRVAEHTGHIAAETIVNAVMRREEIMGTGFEKGLAVPHGRIAEIDKPIIAFGRSLVGIDWDARDGLATHYVFLVLTPEKEEGVQVQILAAIARCMSQPDMQTRIMAAQGNDEIYEIIREGLMAFGEIEKKE